jgi:N-ethylmaleimide reductase
MSTDILFKPLKLGALNLPNRIVMPPLTRMRAGPGGVPTTMNAEYYGQRASAGLNITEATAISVQGHGYPQMPGIHSPEQVEGWRGVTSAVHAHGGRIVLQIVHHGRWSHSSYNPDGSLPVAPSAITPPGHAYTTRFEQVPYETPRALETSELPAIVADFRQAARNARAAGFDAVEIHGANGFLLDQFLQDGSNQRNDAYGGNIENRARLLLEVVDGIADDIGRDRVGVRLSPHGNLGGLSDSDTLQHFNAHVAAAERLGMPLPRISALVANVRPADLTHDEATAFDVAYLLCRGGALPDATWRLAVGAFGELGAAQLVYLVGVYAFVSTSLNGFDVPAPERILAAAPTVAVAAGVS